MKNQLALSFASKYQITETIIILGATMLLPVLVHLLPNIGGNLAGAVLLPIFLAPMVAVFFFKKHVAILAGIFAPLFNYILIGSPAPQMVVMLSIEIVAFVFILSLIQHMNVIRYVAAPMAFIVASIIAALTFTIAGILSNPFSFWMDAVITAIPGIILLGLGNLAILKFKK